MKRIALCFDGTWNRPGEPDDLQVGNEAHDDDWFESVDPNAGTETNVCRLYRAIRKGTGEKGSEQLKWYDKGVGTDWYSRLPGGTFGVGLSKNIRDGYRYLVQNYDDGDEIFIFGFSRGAYTARSLVGMIRNAGLLPRPAGEDEMMDAYRLYRNRDRSADSEAARQFREEMGSRIIPIHFLGVWDTVGALGVPIRSLGAFNNELYGFHDTELSSIVKNAYHAVALDEHREPYQATLWDPKEKPGQTMEQRWFVGAHADIGGGYDDRALSDTTLRWMHDKAIGCGLEIDPAGIPTVPAETVAGQIADSFGSFMKGVYRLFSDRYYRPLGATKNGNEVLDETVSSRLSADLNYRPRNQGLKELLPKS